MMMANLGLINAVIMNTKSAPGHVHQDLIRPIQRGPCVRRKLYQYFRT